MAWDPCCLHYFSFYLICVCGWSQAQQARKHFQQLTSTSHSSSSPSSGGRSPQQQVASRRELDLMARLRTEKSSEVRCALHECCDYDLSLTCYFWHLLSRMLLSRSLSYHCRCYFCCILPAHTHPALLMPTGPPHQCTHSPTQSLTSLLSNLFVLYGWQALEARALVSQLQQELTFQQIDDTFDQWGADTSPPPSSSSSTSDDSSSKHFQNIYGDRNIRQQQEHRSYAATGGAPSSGRPPRRFDPHHGQQSPPDTAANTAADTAAGHASATGTDRDRDRDRDRNFPTTFLPSPPSVRMTPQSGGEGAGAGGEAALAAGDLAARLRVVSAQLQHVERWGPLAACMPHNTSSAAPGHKHNHWLCAPLLFTALILS